MTRYSRQERFNPIGKVGQQKIRNKHVLLIGIGALGTSLAEGLVRAGIGRLTIMDRDYVEWSNLQRQQLFTENDAIDHTPKVIAAKNALQKMNSDCEIDAYVCDVGPVELEKLSAGMNIDLILDGTDNFETRLVINDFAQKYQIPWIYGACVGSYGISYTIIPRETPCLYCLLEAIPLGGATCDTAGIISPTVQLVTSLQLVESLKLLTENRNAMRETLYTFDLWENSTRELTIQPLKKSDCPCCGDEKTHPFLDDQAMSRSAVLCGRDAVQIRPSHYHQTDLEVVANKLREIGLVVKKNDQLLIMEENRHRIVLFKDGRAIVHGTTDKNEAKSIYHRYLG
ncbi:hypothetical protein Q75_06855 [Bacillus coahuilensis p1.1.43]|uniref:THIF-type NAD/FAD binding fold domain-containing protein n=1 Tax=Bacillus coahuilensis p1.1.43 TaxID=1150625 RepID=A0A147K9G3_9BACI|nr:ThiF family adenylyltransferase [Bacillus coahuilensis]KUP06921.1 hypothetical protein Q75_06855 [Bacillus coahuilensis p1.1.43]